MTISIWRYSHLTLALVSGLFLVLASVTGIILAFEPIQSSVKDYKPESLSSISLAETLEALQNEYDEVLTLKVDANDFLAAEVITKSGETEAIFVNPRTGVKLGDQQSQHPIFQFTTNLHRSLFLKSVGRFFVGLVSFLLCLIAFTGLLLLIKRQGGLRKLYSRVQKDYFELRYHVILGRWFLLPIIIIAATGVYLSAEKFSLLPTTKVEHKTVEPEEDVDFSVKSYELPIFKEIGMDQIRSVSFPFSEFPEDYFEIALKDRELYVHQYTGTILSEQQYPFTALAGKWSLVLHTGQGSILWALVLLLASCSLLFFMYSGFVMWRRRLRNSTSVEIPKDKDECSHIILVGSETGNTFGFAKVLEKGLSEAGKTVFVAQMNDYATFAKTQHLIILTATYGEGEAPTNARYFRELVKTIQPKNPISYSVVGFGSLTYPSYCQFAVEVDALLQETAGFKAMVPLYKINNQSFEAFKDWSKKWGEAAETSVKIVPLKRKIKPLKKLGFQVAQRTALNLDDTFIIRLRPEKKLKFQSGDLWEYRADDGIARWYSIARINNQLVLSIKKHEYGVASTFLSSVKEEQVLSGGLKRNHDFHKPNYARELVCIANGTGIAPFLGMLDENEAEIPIEMYWGGRTKKSFAIYSDIVNKALSSNRLKKLHLAFSQETEEKEYVQDVLRKHGDAVAKKLDSGAVFMLCGSLAMQNEVLDVLAELCEKHLNKPLSDFEHQEQLLMDCY